MIGNMVSKSDLRSYFKAVGEKRNKNSAVAAVFGKNEIQNSGYSSGKSFRRGKFSLGKVFVGGKYSSLAQIFVTSSNYPL